MRDLRTITLCNIFYKIIAKVLSNRLKPFMDSLIEQNAFVKDRLITNNNLICREIMHSLKLRKKGKNYGTTEVRHQQGIWMWWMTICRSYVANLGLHSKWIHGILQCVITVSYSIQINEHCFRYLSLSRGLWPGDPLSSYLILFCAKGLSFAIKKASKEFQFLDMHLSNSPSICWWFNTFF